MLCAALLCRAGTDMCCTGTRSPVLTVCTAFPYQFAAALSDVPTGVYCGWASLPVRPLLPYCVQLRDSVLTSAYGPNGQTQPYKAVVNVGYSPTFVG
eukprot:3004620-Rhodomonas_salina.1